MEVGDVRRPRTLGTYLGRYRADLDKRADSQSFNQPTTARSIVLGMVNEERMWLGSMEEESDRVWMRLKRG